MSFFARAVHVGILCLVILGLTGCADEVAVAPRPPAIVPFADGAPSGVFVVVSDSNASIGTVVTVALDVRQPLNHKPIGAFQARFVFDSSGLEYLGDLSGNGSMVNVVGDTARISGAVANEGFANGRLAILSFRVISTSGLKSYKLMVDEIVDVDFADKQKALNIPAVRLNKVAAAVGSSGYSVYGDPTGEGTISAADALAILTHLVGLIPSGTFDNSAADVTEDGKITALDAQIVLRHTVMLSIGSFRVGDLVGSVPITVSSVSPSILRPGIVATITGTNFSTVIAKDTVWIDSVPAVVTAATPTQLTVTVSSSYECRIIRNVSVRVRSAGATSRVQTRLRVAPQRSLAIGESLMLFDLDSLKCNEFPDKGRYLFAILDASKQWQVAYTKFQFFAQGGSTSGLLPNVLNIGNASSLAATTLPSRSVTPSETLIRKRGSEHLKMMQRNREIAMLGRGKVARKIAGVSANRLYSAQSVSTTVGQYSSMKVIHPTKNDSLFNVRARTVYVGTRAIILEDTLAPLRGQMDSYYQQLGSEFDNVMYSILSSNFGNPLAMDANLDNNGRIIMLFTPIVNNRFSGAAAFVTACDFLLPTACPASNLAEVFYGAVPTKVSQADPYDMSATAGWYNWMRSTVIHEGKHITAYAEKYARAASPVLEESWLEEGTAQIAAELYARYQYSFAWKSNVDYQKTIYCELRLCPNYSLNMVDHFLWLHDYELHVNELSPIDPGYVNPTIYGSAWMLLRWAADHYASDESVFFKSLVQQATASGTSNLEAVTGDSWQNMLAQWGLALASDDLTGITGKSTFPSWATRNIFDGMSRDLSGISAAPLRKISPGSTADVNLAAGGVMYVEYDIPASYTIAVTLRANSTTPLPQNSNLRMAVIRLP